jgi:hypothetical protein
MESMYNSDQDRRPNESAEVANSADLDVLSKAKHARRFKNGLLWMGAGALTLVSSFVINFLCFQCGVDFHLPMYVLTSLGALGLLKGMMSIF